MTSTSTKLALAASATLLFASMTAAYYYGDQETGSITESDSGFQVPEFESQDQLIAELVAPFIFVSVLLQILFSKVLHFIFHDDENVPWAYYPDRKPKVRKEATLMSVTVTAMMVPTPVWDFVRLAIASIGVIAMAGFIAVAAFVIYVAAGSF